MRDVNKTSFGQFVDEDNRLGRFNTTRMLLNVFIGSINDTIMVSEPLSRKLGRIR